MSRRINSNKITHIRNKIPLKIPIVVEGKKDKKVLERIGFKYIIPISGKSAPKILGVIKKKKYNKIAILTDFDKEGKRKCWELTRLFQKNGIKIDFFVRRTFNRIFKIHKIEELNSYMKLIESGYYGKDYSIYKKTLNRKKLLNKRKKKDRM